MATQPSGGYDSAHINEILANRLASNDRSYFFIEMLAKFFPIVLSSLIAAYSIITTSDFSDVQQVVNFSSYILLTCILFSVFSIYIMVALNQSILRELRISKRVVEHDESSKEYSVQYLYKPIYNNSIRRSINEAANELSGTAFVILFPGGISDIILGFASNAPQLGIYSTGQIITGIVFFAVSALLLLVSIKLEGKNLKKSKAKETEAIKKVLEKVQADPLKEEEIKVIFKEDGASFLYS